MRVDTLTHSSGIKAWEAMPSTEAQRDNIREKNVERDESGLAAFAKLRAEANGARAKEGVKNGSDKVFWLLIAREREE